MPVCPTCLTQCEEGVPVCPVDGTGLLTRDLVGQVLGDRYRILERIGEGGMGTVYLCEHVALKRKMALKLLRREFCSDEDLVRRFQQEAQAAGLIGQENIVDVIDFGRTPEGSLYFVMEALEGESLASVLRRERMLPTRRALPILGQVCRALAAAHAHGVIHRDLKPDNVFLITRNGVPDFVKVLDFGISKYGATQETHRITRAGSIIGTPEYMAPEQAAATAVDHRCDIYAFGVLAYEIFTGTLPFQGETALTTLIKHQSEPPERPSRRNPDIPPPIERFILKALVKQPQGRQQSMTEVAAGLSQALKAIGLKPVRTETLGATLLRSVSLTTARFVAPVLSKVTAGLQLARGQTVSVEITNATPLTAHRWRKIAIMSVGLLLLGAAAAGAWWWHSQTLAKVQQAALPVVPKEAFTPLPSAPVERPDPAAAAPAPSFDLGRPRGIMPKIESTPQRAEVAPVAKPSRPDPKSTPKPAAVGRRTETNRKGSGSPGKIRDLKPDPF